MTKFFFAMVCILSCTIAYAYELGEYVFVNDVPAIVIYVDSTGEHGLFMSATACYDKHEVQKLFGTKNWKAFTDDIKVPNITITRSLRGFEDAYLSMPTFDYVKYANMKMQRQKLLTLLRHKTTAYGKENAKIITEFCKENDVDINKYFPDQVWASELGEGWFIPGNAELELYTKFLDIPLEKTYALSTDAFIWRFSFGSLLLYDGFGIDGSVFNSVSATLFAPVTIKSSTLIISNWTQLDENAPKIMNFKNNEKLIHSAVQQKRNVFIDEYYTLDAFVEKKSIYMSFCLYGIKGSIHPSPVKWPYIVAVKEF